MLEANLNITTDPMFFIDQLRELPPTARSVATLVMIIFAIILGFVLFVS